MKSLSKFKIALPWLLDIATNMCTFSQRGLCYRVPIGPGKSWNFCGPFSRPERSWKTAKVMESHGRSWKMMIMSWNFYHCTEKFCSCGPLCRTVGVFPSLSAKQHESGQSHTSTSGSSTTTVTTLESYTVCLEKYAMQIRHGFSFLGHGKSLLKKSGRPSVNCLTSYGS